MESAQKAFAPISLLFKDSFSTLKQTWLHLLLWSVVMFGIFLVVLFVGIAIAGFTGALGLMGNTSSVVPGVWAGLGLIVVIVTFFVSLTLGLVLQAGFIVTIDRVRSKASFGQVFKKSLGVALPLFVMEILGGYVILGGFFLFVIPGIIFAFLLVFLHFEVVLGKEHYIGAMRQSIKLVRSNVGDVLLRVLMWIGINIGVWVVFQMVFLPLTIVLVIGSALGENNYMVTTPLQIVVSVIMWVLKMLWGWVNLVFLYTLYRQAQVAEKPSLHVRTVWLWVVSSIGWVVGIIMLSLFGFLAAAIFEGIGQQAEKDRQKQMMNQLDEYDLDSQYENLPEQITVPTVTY